MKKFAIVLIGWTIMSSCNHKVVMAVSKTFIHPGSGYSKAVVVISNDVKTIYIAGLTGDGNDLEAQTKATFANIKIELEAAGAGLKDIVKMNTYIVNYQSDDIEIFRKIRKEILGESNMPASTVVGVQALAAKGKLIEIDAIAVININK
ncbi:RidA family protein [Parasediminibacterium paludis]|uniref:RidA family protein n=1 Tax=Parasediminibacterium paludis TaxID=908966 RepID=A0ABV8PWN0_9BACT